MSKQNSPNQMSKTLTNFKTKQKSQFDLMTQFSQNDFKSENKSKCSAYTTSKKKLSEIHTDLAQLQCKFHNFQNNLNLINNGQTPSQRNNQRIQNNYQESYLQGQSQINKQNSELHMEIQPKRFFCQQESYEQNPFKQIRNKQQAKKDRVYKKNQMIGVKKISQKKINKTYAIRNFPESYFDNVELLFQLMNKKKNRETKHLNKNRNTFNIEVKKQKIGFKNNTIQSFPDEQQDRQKSNQTLKNQCKVSKINQTILKKRSNQSKKLFQKRVPPIDTNRLSKKIQNQPLQKNKKSIRIRNLSGQIQNYDNHFQSSFKRRLHTKTAQQKRRKPIQNIKFQQHQFPNNLNSNTNQFFLNKFNQNDIRKIKQSKKVSRQQYQEEDSLLQKINKNHSRINHYCECCKNEGQQFSFIKTSNCHSKSNSKSKSPLESKNSYKPSVFKQKKYKIHFQNKALFRQSQQCCAVQRQNIKSKFRQNISLPKSQQKLIKNEKNQLKKEQIKSYKPTIVVNQQQNKPSLTKRINRKKQIKQVENNQNKMHYKKQQNFSSRKINNLTQDKQSQNIVYNQILQNKTKNNQIANQTKKHRFTIEQYQSSKERSSYDPKYLKSPDRSLRNSRKNINASQIRQKLALVQQIIKTQKEEKQIVLLQKTNIYKIYEKTQGKSEDQNSLQLVHQKNKNTEIVKNEKSSLRQKKNVYQKNKAAKQNKINSQPKQTFLNQKNQKENEKTLSNDQEQCYFNRSIMKQNQQESNFMLRSQDQIQKLDEIKRQKTYEINQQRQILSQIKQVNKQVGVARQENIIYHDRVQIDESFTKDNISLQFQEFDRVQAFLQQQNMKKTQKFIQYKKGQKQFAETIAQNTVLIQQPFFEDIYQVPIQEKQENVSKNIDQSVTKQMLKEFKQRNISFVLTQLNELKQRPIGINDFSTLNYEFQISKQKKTIQVKNSHEVQPFNFLLQAKNSKQQQSLKWKINKLNEIRTINETNKNEKNISQIEEKQNIQNKVKSQSNEIQNYTQLKQLNQRAIQLKKYVRPNDETLGIYQTDNQVLSVKQQSESSILQHVQLSVLQNQINKTSNNQHKIQQRKSIHQLADFATQQKFKIIFQQQEKHLKPGAQNSQNKVEKGRNSQNNQNIQKKIKFTQQKSIKQAQNKEFEIKQVSNANLHKFSSNNKSQYFKTNSKTQYFKTNSKTQGFKTNNQTQEFKTNNKNILNEVKQKQTQQIQQIKQIQQKQEDFNQKDQLNEIQRKNQSQIYRKDYSQITQENKYSNTLSKRQCQQISAQSSNILKKNKMKKANQCKIQKVLIKQIQEDQLNDCQSNCHQKFQQLKFKTQSQILTGQLVIKKQNQQQKKVQNILSKFDHNSINHNNQNKQNEHLQISQDQIFQQMTNGFQIKMQQKSQNINFQETKIIKTQQKIQTQKHYYEGQQSKQQNQFLSQNSIKQQHSQQSNQKILQSICTSKGNINNLSNQVQYNNEMQNQKNSLIVQKKIKQAAILQIGNSEINQIHIQKNETGQYMLNDCSIMHNNNTSRKLQSKQRIELIENQYKIIQSNEKRKNEQIQIKNLNCGQQVKQLQLRNKASSFNSSSANQFYQELVQLGIQQENIQRDYKPKISNLWKIQQTLVNQSEIDNYKHQHQLSISENQNQCIQPFQVDNSIIKQAECYQSQTSSNNIQKAFKRLRQQEDQKQFFYEPKIVKTESIAFFKETSQLKSQILINNTTQKTIIKKIVSSSIVSLNLEEQKQNLEKSMDSQFIFNSNKQSQICINMNLQQVENINKIQAILIQIKQTQQNIRENNISQENSNDKLDNIKHQSFKNNQEQLGIKCKQKNLQKQQNKISAQSSVFLIKNQEDFIINEKQQNSIFQNSKNSTFIQSQRKMSIMSIKKNNSSNLDSKTQNLKEIQQQESSLFNTAKNQQDDDLNERNLIYFQQFQKTHRVELAEIKKSQTAKIQQNKSQNDQQCFKNSQQTILVKQIKGKNRQVSQNQKNKGDHIKQHNNQQKLTLNSNIINVKQVLNNKFRNYETQTQFQKQFQPIDKRFKSCNKYKDSQKEDQHVQSSSENQKYHCNKQTKKLNKKFKKPYNEFKKSKCTCFETVHHNCTCQMSFNPFFTNYCGKGFMPHMMSMTNQYGLHSNPNQFYSSSNSSKGFRRRQHFQQQGERYQYSQSQLNVQKNNDKNASNEKVIPQSQQQQNFKKQKINRQKRQKSKENNFESRADIMKLIKSYQTKQIKITVNHHNLKSQKQLELAFKVLKIVDPQSKFISRLFQSNKQNQEYITCWLFPNQKQFKLESSFQPYQIQNHTSKRAMLKLALQNITSQFELKQHNLVKQYLQIITGSVVFSIKSTSFSKLKNLHKHKNIGGYTFNKKTNQVYQITGSECISTNEKDKSKQTKIIKLKRCNNQCGLQINKISNQQINFVWEQFLTKFKYSFIGVFSLDYHIRAVHIQNPKNNSQNFNFILNLANQDRTFKQSHKLHCLISTNLFSKKLQQEQKSTQKEGKGRILVYQQLQSFKYKYVGSGDITFISMKLKLGKYLIMLEFSKGVIEKMDQAKVIINSDVKGMGVSQAKWSSNMGDGIISEQDHLVKYQKL